MNEPFVITITTTESNPKEGRSFFTDNGECIGRVLHARKNDIDPKNPFSSYDVETSEEIYMQLSEGMVKIYGLEDYTVSKSSTHYIRK